MRHKADGRLAGFAMVATGVVIVAWRNVEAPDLVGIGRVLIIVGAVLACYAKLKERTGATHEAFLTGRDVGREEGFEEGFREGQKAKLERPKLVDMAEASARLERERARN